MKKKYLIHALMMAALVLTMTACEKNRNRITVQEPGKNITIIDESKQEESELSVQHIAVAYIWLTELET
nr:hypothetical protein [uncultured Clostridium sp.]